jgi:hypothetical protein
VTAKHAASVAYVRLSDHDVADRHAVTTSTSVAERPSYEDVGLPVADAVEAILAEISELDTMGFDETLVLDESVDT